MIEFVLLACLLKDPSHCETFRFPFAPEHNMPQCVWQSQIWVAQ